MENSFVTKKAVIKKAAWLQENSSVIKIAAIKKAA